MTLKTHDAGLRDSLADLPTEALPEGAQIKFTFYWPDANHWEGDDFMVRSRRFGDEWAGRARKERGKWKIRRSRKSKALSTLPWGSPRSAVCSLATIRASSPGPSLFIKKQFSLSATMEEIVVSSVLAGAVLGAILGGALTDRFGRRKLIILAGIIFTASAHRHGSGTHR